MSIDLTIIAIVFALVLLLVFFSAVVLYLSFRIKETFRKETRRGATVAKTAFLIGILFLAGGIFYFFANSFVAINPPSPSPTASPTSSPTNLPSPTGTANPLQSPTPTQPATSASPSPTNTPNLSGNPTGIPTPTAQPQKTTLTVAYPSTVKMNSTKHGYDQ